ncbi:MAG TPA: 23S rRNA (uracil(1939)-C(5))-methyltransferase RlmD, partial [Anaerolineae bacterium]|nr:23S rRNA (uracil(1939)-C(5))-methyltransferase RlmD [Anaerolineae bacterium]
HNLSEFSNVRLELGLVERVLPAIHDSIDAAVVDPPRAGCGPKVVKALLDHQVKRNVYVSCDPSTLARDARQLLDGGYRLIEVQPIDLFPQTYHIETVALFVRSED